MKRIAIIFSAASILIASCNSSDKKETTKKEGDVPASNEIKAPDDAWVPIDDSVVMKAMMDLAVVGPQHKWMATMDGNWKGDMTMWMNASAPPMTSPSKMSNKMIMGGRYQISEYSGSMADAPFNGMSTMGYDNFKKKFVSTWVDSWSTAILNMEGDYDEASKTLTQSGKFKNPVNGKECEMKQTMKQVDDTHWIMEMWGTDMKTGKMYKNMEIKFTKA